MQFLNHSALNLFSFKKYFITITILYTCIILVNITNIYAKYSHCGPIQFKSQSARQNELATAHGTLLFLDFG